MEPASQHFQVNGIGIIGSSGQELLNMGSPFKSSYCMPKRLGAISFNSDPATVGVNKYPGVVGFIRF